MAFLNGELKEDVYVSQLEGFVDQDNPSHVYELYKTLYGLKQAPRTWYDMLSSFLISQHFSKGVVDPTLFTWKAGNNLLLAKPIEKHLNTVKRIFRYLKRTINMGLWYSKDTGMSLTTYADADHAGCQDTRRSTSGSAQFLGPPCLLLRLRLVGGRIVVRNAVGKNRVGFVVVEKIRSLRPPPPSSFCSCFADAISFKAVLLRTPDYSNPREEKLRSDRHTHVSLQPIQKSKCCISVDLPSKRVLPPLTLLKPLAYSFYILSQLTTVPDLEGNGYTKETIRIEYEWVPRRCSTCLIYDPKRGEEWQISTPLVERINVLEKQMLEGKLVLTDDDRKPFEKVDYAGNTGSEDEVERDDNETESFLASKPMGVGHVGTMKG
nr:retrovirus-related Pol polyprotein from transposon TNT 1-94 [Tanacetum cinerariifolium]